jgi:hypothetical protein
MGVTASSDDCFLGLRGLRTLVTRLARQQASAIKVAEWLRARPEVNEVIYPALPGSRGHEFVEARLRRRDIAVRHCPQSSFQGAHRRDARRHAPLRHGLELGRVRKPDHSDLTRNGPAPFRIGKPADRRCASTSASRTRTT